MIPSVRLHWLRRVAFALATTFLAAAIGQAAEDYAARLAEQGVCPERVIGWDRYAVPHVCGTGQPNAPAAQVGGLEVQTRSVNALPAGYISWECVPSVIRADGRESFCLEVTPAASLSRLTLRMQGFNNLRTLSNGLDVPLLDDGRAGDRVAGDGTYTSESLFFTNATVVPTHYQYDTNSPAGIFFADLGVIELVDTLGTTNRLFLVGPQVGVVGTNTPLVETVRLSASVIATAWLLNVQTSERLVQRFLRTGGNITPLTRMVYGATEDGFDFLMLLATDRIERSLNTASENFISGLNLRARVSFTGAGDWPYTNSAYYGSAGRLQSVNLLDTGARGLWANNAVHELMHHWAAYLDPSLGLNRDGAHYAHQSDIGSVLGGGAFTNSPSGQLRRDCDDESAPRRIDPLDRYLMGLIPGREVPPIRLFSRLADCGQAMTNQTNTVTIEQIQARHGIRAPGPDAAQRSFALGFVVESFGRPLNRTEMSFYSRLAEHFAKPIPAIVPDPSLLYWPSIRRHFGADTDWQSAIRSLVRPRLLSGEIASATNFVILAAGFPGQTYRIERSFDLRTWQTQSLVTAQTDGTVLVQDAEPSQLSHRFFRLAWP